MAGIPLTLLSWIKSEVDSALKAVRDSIARFLAAPEDAAVLLGCPGQLHQVSGALRIVGLAGATRFCETIEGSFGKLNEGRPSKSALGVIDRAVHELNEFVDDLAQGQANAPLRLFPAYRDLATLQGRRDASERELFFPELDLQAPPHPDAKTLSKEELGPFLQTQRTRFQRGLLAWLRKQPDGLGDMRQALDTLHQVSAQLPEPRALWWAATGVIDGLSRAPEADWLANANGLCNKIDFQLRDLALGSESQGELLLRDILYAIGRCKAVTPRMKSVRQLYQLDSLFPEPDMAGLMTFDMDWLQPALSDARSRLEILKSAWLHYVSGEPKSAMQFRELLASYKAKAGELGSPQLVRLLDVIALVAARLPDPYPRQTQLMVLEMASAFLFVESILDSFTSPPAYLEEQIRIMGGWLLDAAKGNSTGEPPAGLRVDLSRRIGAIQLRAQVAREIFANLRHVEKVLDAFARDSVKRDALPALKPHLRQIHGALAVLRLERAAEILSACDAMITECATADHARTARNLDWIAEGLSTLEFYLEPCVHGGDPLEQSIKLFFSRFSKRGAPTTRIADDEATIHTTSTTGARTVVVPLAAPGIESVPAMAESAAAKAPESESAPSAATSEPAVDRDLLAIFLDEAGEVLAGIDTALPRCRAQPHNREVLTTIRRGFHTLKGSGRMVGLADFGEVAWRVEQAVNRYLEQRRPATPGLIELIAVASATFSAWITELQSGKPPAVDAERITTLAHQLLTEDEAVAEAATAAPVEAATFAAAPVAPADAPAEPAEEFQEVTIGTTRLARGFFEVYLREATQHVATLQTEFDEWCNSAEADASHELLRAAHTLASSSRTAGFSAIADLAGAVEHWTPFARRVSGERDVEAVRVAIELLQDMIKAVAQGHAPAPPDDALRILQETIARLRNQTVRLAQPASAPGAPAGPATSAPVEPGAETARVPVDEDPRKFRDDIDEQLLPIFLEEARELLPQIGTDLREWKASPDDHRISQSLRRALHTLKGSARMAGAIRLGELTHLLESEIDAAIQADGLPTGLFESLESKMDRLSLGLERLQKSQAVGTVPPAEAGEPAGDDSSTSAAPRAEAPLPSPAALLRINADTLDHLINASGEVSIARSRVEAELRTAKQSLGELSESINRLRGQLREVEIQADSQLQSRASMLNERNRDFDPLEFDRYTRMQELTRLMGESLHDAISIQQALLKNLGETDSALLQQARISRDVQQALMRMRAVPFSTLNERLYRIVRQVARDLGKKAELEIEGSQVEVDRGVLERVGAPLEHMLRNALAHGLEAPAARVLSGKPETGRIAITLRQESNEIALTMSDDGAGLDLELLHRKALDRGILRPDQRPAEIELVQLIFAGLSTAEEVTELSGRGVGMDVVRSEIASLGGRIDVETVRGKGTTFTIYLPLTVAVTQAVIVRAGGTVLAISSAMVEQVLRLKADEMARLYETRTVKSQNRTLPLHALQVLLGVNERSKVQTYNSVLLLRSGAQRVALHVDELIGNQEIVVKKIGPQLARVPGIAGATVLADGNIALIVNPVQLAHRAARSALARATGAEAVLATPAGPVIMVVDDSLTVRNVTSRLLEREGYRVVTAKDGVDALEQMREMLPDVMLVDIEMPRMDGFDLTRIVRREPHTQHIPIIIISSRTADKHRSQAAQLGANAFLGKPYQESDLLEHVAKFLAGRKQAALN
ncbi:MAG TPA: Hpt domain-containing protein [Burkholderiales bacterium]|jgi:chemosensory pili system protein ChpA (sensor histidine kinase/response regulator)